MTNELRPLKPTLFTTSAMRKDLSSSTRCDCDWERAGNSNCLDGGYRPPTRYESKAGCSPPQNTERIEMVDRVTSIEADKIGSATSPLRLSRSLKVAAENDEPRAGDVVVVRV